MKNIVTAFVMTLILVGTLTVTFSVRIAKAGGTIHIRADGSVDPPTAAISTLDKVTYTFVGNVADSIVVERDDIVVDGAGYTLQGGVFGIGLNLTGRGNVTIKNIEIKEFMYGIQLSASSNNSIFGNSITTSSGDSIQLCNSSNYNNISGNSVTDNGDGIRLCYDSSDNSISGNNVTSNRGYGIILQYSSDSNSITGNNVTANNLSGISLDSSSSNDISGNNVTINGADGIKLCNSSHNSIIGNDIEANIWRGIGLYTYSSFNNVFGNKVIDNENGIMLVDECLYNTISGNSITANNQSGIHLGLTSSNTICGNNFTNNRYGIYLFCSSDNTVYHNSFVTNTVQVYAYQSANALDNGYPSGGNFWSDYAGVDVYSGPYQDQPGSDGIGDTPYVVDGNNQDKYPLITPYSGSSPDIGIMHLGTSKTVVGQGCSLPVHAKIFNYGNSTEHFNVTVYANTTIIHIFEDIPLTGRNFTIITFTWNTVGFAKGNYTISAVADTVPDEIDTADNTFTDVGITLTIPGDVNGNRVVNIFDIVLMAGGYGTLPPNPKYNPNCDIDGDGDIDIFDIVRAAGNYGKSW